MKYSFDDSSILLSDEENEEDHEGLNLEAINGKHWVSLQRCLRSKELQLVELREQHDQLINRSKDALQNWKGAIQAKDDVIQQLQHALRAQLFALEKQENINKETKRRFRHKDLEDKGKDIENKIHFEKLQEQQYLIEKLKAQLAKRDEAGSPDIKVEVLLRKVQSLENLLCKRESELKDLTGALRKKDKLLQFVEEKLESSVWRQNNILEYLDNKFEHDTSTTGKTRAQIQQELPTSSLKAITHKTAKQTAVFLHHSGEQDKIEDDVEQMRKQIKAKAKSKTKCKSKEIYDGNSNGQHLDEWLKQHRTSEEAALGSLLEEIKQRELIWKGTEARMRAELSRRINQVKNYPDRT